MSRRPAPGLLARFENDAVACAFVQTHPMGADRAVVGEALGVTRETVRLIENEARRWFWAVLVLDAWAAGVSVHEWLAANLGKSGDSANVPESLHDPRGL